VRVAAPLMRRSDRFARHPTLGLVVVGLLLASVLSSMYGSIGPPVGPWENRNGVDTGSTADANHTHPNGNLTIANSEPGQEGITDDILSMTLELTVVGWNDTLGAFNVTVPGCKATFFYGPNATPLSLFENRQNLTIAGPGQVSPAPTSLILAEDIPFDSSVPSVFSTNLLALMTPYPTGSVNVSARWEWKLESNNGASVSSWSPWVLATPSQAVWLTSYSGSEVAIDTTYQVCLSGPIVGRYLSLHIEVPSPVNDFSKSTEEVPSGTHGPFCLSVPVESNDTVNLTPPEPLLVHVWAYSGFPLTNLTVTFLLYVINVQLVTSLPLSSPSGGSSTIAIVGTAAIAVVLTAIGAAYVIRFRRRRRGPTSTASESTVPNSPVPPP
jgi:hypothetical protein